MNMLLRWFDQPLAIRAGWMLLHSLWQGALIGGLFELARFGLRRRSAHARYVAGCLTMLLLLAAPAITCLNGSMTGHRQTNGLPPEVSAATTDVLVLSSPFGGYAYGSAASSYRAIFAALGQITPWLTAAWLVGVVLFSAKLMRSWWWVGKIRARELDPVDVALLAMLDGLRRRLNISRPVRLLKSALVEVPTVVGWLRPVILLPAATVAGLSPRQLEAVLAHELAHVRRWDYAVNAFQCVAETLLFYHPVVWWVSHCVREERENCCDDVVVRVCGDRLGYARALATLEAFRTETPRLAFAASGGSLLQRIRRLLGGDDERPANPDQWAGLALLVTGLALIAFGVWLNLRPLTYESVTRIRLDRDNADPTPISERPAVPASYDPYFIQTEFEVIKSDVVLSRVVDSLDLTQEWGKRYGSGKQLTRRATLVMLRQRLDVRPVQNTSLIEIRAASENPDEAAKLANRIAEEYRSFRLEQRRDLTQAGITSLEEHWAEQETQIRQAQSDVDKLRRGLNISELDAKSDAPIPSLDTDALHHIQSELLTLETDQVKIETVLKRLKAMSPVELREAIQTAVGTDTELANLVTEWNAAGEKVIALEKDYATNHPVYLNAKAVTEDLNRRIQSRVDGIVAGYEVRLDQVRNAALSLQEKLDRARAEDLEAADKTRPYYEAKQRLDELIRFRTVLAMKIASEQTDAQLPKLTPVAIVDTATPALAPSSPNRPRALGIMLVGGVIAAAGFFKLRRPPEHEARPALKTA